MATGKVFFTAICNFKLFASTTPDLKGLLMHFLHVQSYEDIVQKSQFVDAFHGKRELLRHLILEC